MSAARVLGAAAALRIFDLDQIAAFCDEPRDVIVAILEDASDCVEPVGDSGDRWRVEDRMELRRRSRIQPPGIEALGSRRHDPQPIDDLTETRLRYAEERLMNWDEELPFEERRLQLLAATNALRQAVADVSSTPRTWWQIEIDPGRQDPESWSVDAVTLTRLQVTQAVAYLTRQGLNGNIPNTDDLVASVRGLRSRAQNVDLQPMSGLVKRFVDLTLTLIAPSPDWARSGRLVATTALRRVGAVVRTSLTAGLDELIPVVEGMAESMNQPPSCFGSWEICPPDANTSSSTPSCSSCCPVTTNIGQVENACSAHSPRQSPNPTQPINCAGTLRGSNTTSLDLRMPATTR